MPPTSVPPTVMSNDADTLALGLSVREATVKRIVRICLALGGLLVVLGLVAVLPGIDRLLAGLSVSPIALLTAIATVLIVVALVWIAPTVQRAVEQALDGPTAVVSNVAASTKLLVGFLAVVIAYRGFAPIATPTFEAFDLGGVYHLGFLVVGVVVLGAFTRRLYRCWEPLTQVLTAHATDALGTDRQNGVSTE